MTAYQLRRIVKRQQSWDNYLRQLGRDSRLRSNPEAIKDALCAWLRGCRVPKEAEPDLRAWLTQMDVTDLPRRLDRPDPPKRLRMLAQLELTRAPKNPFRKATPALVERIKELAGREPRPSLRQIAGQLRRERFDVSYATVWRVLRAGQQARTYRGKVLRDGEVRARSYSIS